MKFDGILEKVLSIQKMDNEYDFVYDLREPESKASIYPKKMHFDKTLTAERGIEQTENLGRAFNFQKNLIENSMDGILGCDEKGKIVTFNKSMAKMLGYSKEEVVDKKFFHEFSNRIIQRIFFS